MWKKLGFLYFKAFLAQILLIIVKITMLVVILTLLCAMIFSILKIPDKKDILSNIFTISAISSLGLILLIKALDPSKIEELNL